VTGVQVLCKWDGTDKKEPRSGESILVLECLPTQGAINQLTSADQFFLEYRVNAQELRIKHDWSCGDILGKYSTEFSAAKNIIIPLYCTEDGGNTCRANKLTVRGELSKPVPLGTPETIYQTPPNINVAGCTLNSATPRWTITKFFFNRTGVGNARGDDSSPPYFQPQSRILELEVRNLANLRTTSCIVTDRVFDGNTDQWFPCETDTAAQYELQTYVKYNVSEHKIHFNQTWICSDTDPDVPYVTLHYKYDVGD
jgi:hypothetical protein